MEVNARVSKDLNQIRIIKRGSWDCAMSTADAKMHWERGNIKKHNKVFARLVENNFDVKKTLEHFKGVRDRIIEERKNA